jgi:HK97 family phage major capsid protein
VSKPAAYLNFTKRTVNVEKLAAFLPISEEMLEDEPAIAAYVNTRLRMFVVQAEEARILARLNIGIGTAGYGELGGNNMLDSVMAGITSVRLEGGLEPDGLIINPTDYAKMAIAKASTGGDYFGGGPFSAFSASPWGLRTVPTAAAAAGSPIVGAFRDGAQIWRKGGLTVEASNSHADYFVRNLVAIRAEERFALAVYRPLAFQKLFLTS